jgi:hypothetical protein
MLAARFNQFELRGRRGLYGGQFDFVELSHLCRKSGTPIPGSEFFGVLAISITELSSETIIR